VLRARVENVLAGHVHGWIKVRAVGGEGDLLDRFLGGELAGQPAEAVNLAEEIELSILSRQPIGERDASRSGVGREIRIKPRRRRVAVRPRARSGAGEIRRGVPPRVRRTR